MSKLNFAIALKMTTDQFQKGANAVKQSIKNIQYQVLGMASALGVGALGLKGLTSKFIDTARETNRARVALKNISGDANGFASNMDFLVSISSKWGQELNGMTSEYAKFSAAATSAGISVADQREIFESFTRSITAFGMSSEDAHLSYLALSQMMSKGKISSEELRRQLGERMPIAMEAMARAVGVTIGELDKLLSTGKLMSKDVMLPFMKEMEKMTPTVDVDNIETSVNRLKNAFIKLTQDLNVGDMYKKLVDGANNALAGIQKSFARIAAVIVASVSGAKIGSAYMKLQATARDANVRMLAEKQRTELQKEIAVAKRVAAEKRYEEMNALYKKASSSEQLTYYARMKGAESAMDKSRLVEKAAFQAAEKAAAAKTTTMWGVAWRNVKASATAAFTTIKMLMSSIVPMAILGLLTNFVMKMVELRREAKEISNIFSEYQGKIKDAGTTEEIEKIKSLHAIISQRLGTEEEIKTVQIELNKLLGIEEGKQIDINKQVAERIRMLEAAARVDAAIQAKMNAETQIKELGKKYGSGDSIESAIKSVRGNMKEGWSFGFGNPAKVSDQKKMNELIRVYNDAQAQLYKYVPESLNTSNNLPAGTPDIGKSDKETPLQKAEKKYSEELQKLTNQKESSVISTKEYNKAIDELNEATYKEIGGLLGTSANLNETFRKAMEGVNNPLSSGRLAEVTEDYTKTLSELDNKKRLGLLSEDLYNDELKELISSTIDKVASFDKLSQAEEEYIKNLSSIQKSLASTPTKENRDKTFDYKKSETDILKEEKALQEKYVQDIKKRMDDAKDYSIKALQEIAKEEQELMSLSDALKLAELREDLENLNFDIFSESIDGVTGFANALDRVANSWARLGREDMSAFQTVVALINAMGDTIGGVVRAWEDYNAIKDLISNRETARQSLETAQKVTAHTTEATSAATKSATIVAGLKAEQAAASGVMAAKSTAAYAGMPFVGVGLAAGQIASMQALIASVNAFNSIPGFKDGGIIGGRYKTGDRNLIRANAGEMIMTTAQQSGLWGAIKSGDFGSSGGDVKFRIDGTSLVGVLNNHNRKVSRR